MKKKYIPIIIIIIILGIAFTPKYGILSQLTAEGNNEKATDSQDDKEKEVEEQLDITLAFAGDINLDDTWCNMVYYHNNGDDITKCIDPSYINLMKSADVMWINNEFTYSNQGTPLAGKAYTFRAKPTNVSILKELGVDVVGLANNHIYDYGLSAFRDTLSTLDDAGIKRSGAGNNLKEAMEPAYIKVGDITIAYVAASRAEKLRMTPQATDSQAGILRCYDNTLFLQAISEASKKADIVIALPHWGTEYSTSLEASQINGAKAYIEAGADAVVGAHTHCLQGFEIYNGAPIAYSLGNFWFNEKSLDTMLLVIHITGQEDSPELTMQVLPGKQANYYTRLTTDNNQKQDIFDRLVNMSRDITIDDDGYVTAK